ncbi:MAG: hypothetical protein N2B03_00760 [Boseongicola sp.]
MKQLMILILALGMGFAATTEHAIAKERGAKGCPPGLAKKNTPCVPPGLAKKGVTAGDWQAKRDRDDDDDDYYGIGDRLDRDDYLILQEGDRVEVDGTEYVVIDTDNGVILRRGKDFYRLPRHDDGSGYVRVGETLIRVDRETQQVIELIRLADLIF